MLVIIILIMIIIGRPRAPDVHPRAGGPDGGAAPPQTRQTNKQTNENTKTTTTQNMKQTN